jgi:hypothetical protein
MDVVRLGRVDHNSSVFIGQVRADLVTDPISSILAIGALVGLAGVLLEFNRRQAWSAI